MKIGLLTLTPSDNYGGMLQCVALYKYLESEGHDVTLINKQRSRVPWRKYLIRLLEILPFQNIDNYRSLRKKRAKLLPFLNKYIKTITKSIFSVEELEVLVHDYKFDAVIVGSDQVWRYDYINDGDYSTYFLNFTSNDNIKKISYAASFGKDTWCEKRKAGDVSNYLKDFNAISVREKSGVDLCRDVFGIDSAERTLDPTLLFSSDFYTKFLQTNRKYKREKYLVNYVLDLSQVKLDIVASIKSKYNLFDEISLNVDSKGGYFSVEEWLDGIRGSEIVVTDSFHGMVFSIIFKKQFFVIPNPQRGASRFYALLGDLGLRDRIVTSHEDVRYLNVNDIDYEACFEKLDVLKAASKEFLKQSLL